MLFLVPFFYAALPSFVLTIIISVGMNRRLHFLKDPCVCADQAGSCYTHSGFHVAVTGFWLSELFLPLHLIIDETTLSNCKGRQ